MIASVTSFLAGYAFGFGFFTETPAYIIILMMFFPFNLSLGMIGFFVASIAPNSKASNTASYAIVLLAIVVQSFVSDNNLLTFIFTTNPSTLVSLLRAFLIIYPPFSYTKVLSYTFRSSPTLLSFQDIISTLRSVLGYLAKSHIAGNFSTEQLQALFPLEEALTRGTLTYNPWEFSMLTLHSMPSSLGTSTTSSQLIGAEENPCSSQ
jgi:hypothetical protein